MVVGIERRLTGDLKKIRFERSSHLVGCNSEKKEALRQEQLDKFLDADLLDNSMASRTSPFASRYLHNHTVFCIVGAGPECIPKRLR